MCLYWYAAQSGAYWGAHGPNGYGQVNNLGTVSFFSGSGTGAGYPVLNNAVSIACTIDPYDGCQSYYNQNLGGNYDWLLWGQIGQLHYTWNDEASVRWY